MPAVASRPPYSQDTSTTLNATLHNAEGSGFLMSYPPVPVLSAAPKQMQELDESCCVRLGVFRPNTAVSKEQLVDEIDSVRMTSEIEHVFVEAAAAAAVTRSGETKAAEDDDYEWGRVYFSSGEVAELCAALLSYPGRRSKWHRWVVQRLPTFGEAAPSAFSPVTATEQRMAAVAFSCRLADTLLARGARGLCVLSTTDLLETNGAQQWLVHKRTGVNTSVDVCAAYFPHPDRNQCQQGSRCPHLHLRLEAFPKLLLPSFPVSVAAPSRGGGGGGVGKAGLGVASSAGGATMPAPTAWEVDRCRDTLALHDLPVHVDFVTLRYMFDRCMGYAQSYVVLTAAMKREGVVLFDSPEHATEAMTQANSASDLHVTLLGPTAAETKAATTATSQSDSAASASAASRDQAPGGSDAVSTESAVPFPALPEGWSYGLSRRTGQYFFLQTGKKATTFKHPVTQERYSMKR